MTRVLLDQGLPRSTANSTANDLRAAGWDAVHVGEIAMSQAEDVEILDFAAQEKRIAVRSLSKPSVIRVRIEGLQGTAMSRLLLRIWPTIQEALTTGAVVTVTEQRTRIRYLLVC